MTQKQPEKWYAKYVISGINQWPTCLHTAVTNWLQKVVDCKGHPSISIKTDATSAANQKPVLVDQGTQCDSPYTSLTTEQIRLTTGSGLSKGGLLLAEC